MKATVCSLLPYQVRETKPGLIPDEYIIPKSDGLTPAVLVVEDAGMPVYRGGEMPPFRAIETAEKLAEGIAKCYNESQFGYEEGCHSALFSVPGEFNSGKEILTRFPEKVKAAREIQNRWFMRLIQMADDDWGRNHRHKTITDIQRFAARMMGKTDKPWYVSPEPVPMMKCPACSTLVESEAIVCKTCRAILNPEEAKKKGISFVSAQEPGS